MKVHYLSGYDPVLVSMFGDEMGGFFDEISNFMDKSTATVSKGKGMFDSIHDMLAPKQNPPPPTPAGFNMQSLIIPGAIIGGVLLIKMLKK